MRRLVLAMGFVALGAMAAGAQPTANSGDVPAPSPVAAGPSKVVKTDEEWKALLDASRYRVLRQKGTEPPFTGALHDNHDDGRYQCAGCKAELFDSTDKFDSGTGWPSFTRFVGTAVREESDATLGMTRVEVLCARCDGHLGHVFDDGPAPTGKRYCINSASLTFTKKPEPAASTAASPGAPGAAK